VAKKEGKMAQEKMTERIITVVLTLVVAGVLGVVGTALSRGALIGALGGVQETKPALAERVAILEAQSGATITTETVANIVDTKFGEVIPTLAARVEVLETGNVPRGVVVAFDRDDLNADKCPPGWQPFKEARARAIIGAGDPKKAPGKFGFGENGQPLTHFTHRQHGGEEEHTLTIEEMPKHAHGLEVEYWYHTGKRKVLFDETQIGEKSGLDKSKIGFQGSGQPHNNMPPHIALYFCKKD
jgi:hypothetical protein